MKLSKFQEKVFGFAKAIGWVDLANILRENLQLCCCSMALLLAASASPYLVPKPVIKPLQNAFIFLAFPLVGVISLSSYFFCCTFLCFSTFFLCVELMNIVII